VPYAINKGVRIYWEEQGEGPPMLLIMGLSFTLEMWYRIRPALAERYRVIVFDNRGVGRSDSPQELALRYPSRFRALLLGCTACGPFYRAAWPNFERSPGLWKWVSLRGEARERALIRLLYADGTPMSRIEEDIRIRCVNQPSTVAVLSQLAGILAWSSFRRLPQLRLPTLVVHGEQDHILPSANGRVVSERIPGSELVLLPNAGHMITTDQPEMCLEVIERFLDQVSDRVANELVGPAGAADVDSLSVPGPELPDQQTA
jgi:3-oxoadipate enol-lactonase